MPDGPSCSRSAAWVAHKNFALITRALQACPPSASFDVAIAGGCNPRVFGGTGLANDPRIKWLGYVSDGQLRALYEAAAAFVFPSRSDWLRVQRLGYAALALALAHLKLLKWGGWMAVSDWRFGLPPLSLLLAAGLVLVFALRLLASGRCSGRGVEASQ